MTPEQQGLLCMSLQAARGLNETGFAEFAASRAYYAMFYVAEVLEGEGLSFQAFCCHCCFGQQFARTGRVS